MSKSILKFLEVYLAFIAHRSKNYDSLQYCGARCKQIWQGWRIAQIFDIAYIQLKKLWVLRCNCFINENMVKNTILLGDNLSGFENNIWIFFTWLIE